MAKKIIGPFKQIITLQGLPMKGALKDEQLVIVADGGVLVEDGLILEISNFLALKNSHSLIEIEEIESEEVLLPGFIDCHTHICFAGTRANDYALRIQGKSYLDIAKAGGGIWDSVTQTRAASEEQLTQLLLQRVEQHLNEGVTTIEVKSGYGLNVFDELKQLRAIKGAAKQTNADLIPTCLAAHMLPKDFNGNADEYLAYVLSELLPKIKQENLANRVDIFIEESAYNINDGFKYLLEAKNLGFDLTVHADQFTVGGSAVAVKSGALSADHLEAISQTEINLLSNSNTVAVALPGASLGLGIAFTPARKLLDAGACVAIASDWNPGSAPMGDLLTQAAILSAYEKLCAAEVFAGLTFRAAQALKLNDRGFLAPGMIADMQSFPTNDYREILYHQGKLKPIRVWKAAKLVNRNSRSV
jgi:imidazolonepropionase